MLNAKFDCFARVGSKGCFAIETRACPGYDVCPFYKTQEDATKSAQKAHARLRFLPEEVQSAIADKYYFSNRPWLYLQDEVASAI